MNIYISSKKFIVFMIVVISITLIAFITTTAQASTIEDLFQQKNQATKEYEYYVSQQEEIQSNINLLEIEIQSTKGDLDNKEAKLANMVKGVYTSSISPTKIVIDSIISEDTSLNEIIKNLDYCDKIMEEQNRIVSDVREAKEALDNKLNELESSKKEIDELVVKAEETKNKAVAAYNEMMSKLSPGGEIYDGDYPSGWMTVSQMKFTGRVNANDFSYTYYSELMLPGPGLNIPGRHTESCGCVCDGDGYVVLAQNRYARGQLLPTPLVCHPIGRVYDRGGMGPDGVDIYVR